MKKIACSILKANFINLSKTLDKLKKVNIEWIHYDVMDNNFVPNISFGPWILENISTAYNFMLDIHLMVNIKGDIDSFLKQYLKNNVKQITVHREALDDVQLDSVYNFCKENNVDFSISINPKTSIDAIKNYINKVDNILLMSVEPGFGGQKFNDIVYEKIKQLNILKNKNNFKIQIDGGVNGENINKLFGNGVDWVVAGSWLTDDIDKIEEKLTDVK